MTWGKTALRAAIAVGHIDERGARTIVIAEVGDETVTPYASDIIRIPDKPAA